ncbi:MAG: hypothetical protein JXR86_15745 [Spirochaetales bacterium]|nr:hypothetical protein [Spirochaetales bacterium]
MNIKFEWIRKSAFLSLLLTTLLTASLFLSFPFKEFVALLFALLLILAQIYHLVETGRIGKLLLRTSDLLGRSTERDFSSLREGDKHIINHEISNLIEQLEDSVKQTEQILQDKDQLERENAALLLKIKAMEQSLNRQVIDVRDRMRSSSAELNSVIADFSRLLDASTGERIMIDSLLETNSGYSRHYRTIEDSFSKSRKICSLEEAKGQEAESILNALSEKDEERDEKIHSVIQGIGNIQEVTGIINEVAEKASILSLNAAIESAHAGEAGKGFSVVAEEVGVLADMTAEHAEIINQALYSVTDSINESRYSDRDGMEEESFSIIGGAIREMTASFGEIKRLLDCLRDFEVPEAPGLSRETHKEKDRIGSTLSTLKSLKSQWELTLEEISRLPLFENIPAPGEWESSDEKRHETSVKPVDEALGAETLD